MRAKLMKKYIFIILLLLLPMLTGCVLLNQKQFAVGIKINVIFNPLSLLGVVNSKHLIPPYISINLIALSISLIT